MKRVKMTRTIGQYAGDVTYELADGEADLLIRDGSAEFVAVIAEPPPVEPEPPPVEPEPPPEPKPEQEP